MIHVVRMYFFNTFALWLTSQILPTLVLPDGWQPLVTIGLVLTVLTTLVAPIIRILMIPITFMTLGLATWLVHGIILYLLTIIMPEVIIREWTFPGLITNGFVIPAIELSFPVALIGTSLVLALLTNIFRKINE